MLPKRQFWLFLQRRPNREVLGWLGGGLAVVVGAIWLVFVYFDKPERPSPDKDAAVDVYDGSVAAGRDIVNSTITIERSSDMMTPRSPWENSNGVAEE